MGELLERDAAAQRCGIKPASLTHDASATRRKPEDERTRWDCPLPVDYVRRPRGTGGGKGPATVRVPRWDADDLDAWRAALAEGRPPPPRTRDDTGRYVRAAGQ
jgi:hypothetical protein